MSNFGKRLRELRNEKNLTQDEFGSALHLTQSIIAHYEANRKQPSNQTITQMADFFAVSVDYLLGRTNNRNLNNDEGDYLIPTPKEDHIAFYHKIGQLSDESIFWLEKQADRLIELETQVIEEIKAERKKKKEQK